MFVKRFFTACFWRAWISSRKLWWFSVHFLKKLKIYEQWCLDTSKCKFFEMNCVSDQRGLEVCGDGPRPTVFVDIHIGCMRGHRRHHLAGPVPLRWPNPHRQRNVHHPDRLAPEEQKQTHQRNQPFRQVFQGRLRMCLCVSVRVYMIQDQKGLLTTLYY